MDERTDRNERRNSEADCLRIISWASRMSHQQELPKLYDVFITEVEVTFFLGKCMLRGFLQLVLVNVRQVTSDEGLKLIKSSINIFYSHAYVYGSC